MNTKAPWTLEKYSVLNGEALITFGGTIATDFNYSGWFSIREDDARLIAAAPDLLEALKDALCALQCCGKDFPAMPKAARAIAKATQP